jgi:hypothetical protein
VPAGLRHIRQGQEQQRKKHAIDKCAGKQDGFAVLRTLCSGSAATASQASAQADCDASSINALAVMARSIVASRPSIGAAHAEEAEMKF